MAVTEEVAGRCLGRRHLPAAQVRLRPTVVRMTAVTGKNAGASWYQSGSRLGRAWD